MLCKEPSNVGLLCADFQSLVGVFLNVFDLPCERRTAFPAITWTPEIPLAKPTHAHNDYHCGGYWDTPSQRFHNVSILLARRLRKELSITGVYTYERESASRLTNCEWVTKHVVLGHLHFSGFRVYHDLARIG
jgi:hypothetical protein